MAEKFAAHDALGVACLGLTHPHTSGRVKAMQRLAGTRMLGAADDSPLIKPFAKALDLEIPSKAAILADPDGDSPARMQRAPCSMTPTRSSSSISSPGTRCPGWKAGTSRPMAPRGSCTRVLSPRATRSTTRAKPAAAEGWTEWDETSFPINWASRKTEYSPELAEIGNPAFFDREAAAFINSLRTGTPSVIPAGQAYRINVLIEALFASSRIAGGEVQVGSSSAQAGGC